ncbi:diguanylate cyclase domain-containing protein [Kineococcus glutinatus]|uniref:diguanylate cyclase domain-containing protein n=1 Tax=Kineococcus glutinatus TaxID=1070872 RepID=UPI0031EBE322
MPLGEPELLARRPALRRALFAVLMVLAVLAGHAARFTDTVPVLSPTPAVALLWLAGSPGRRARVIDACALVGLTALVFSATGTSVAGALLLSVAVAVQALASAWAYRLLRPAGLQLRAARDLLVLAAGAGLGAAASVPVALLAFARIPDALIPVSAAQWLLHGALSCLLGVAAVLQASGGATGGRRHTSGPERCGIVVAFALTYGVSFWLLPGAAAAFSLLPVAVWAALRESVRAVTAHLVLTAAAVVLAVRSGHHPWTELAHDVQVVAAEAYLAALALTTLVLALFRAENERNAQRAREQAALLGAVFDSISDAVAVLDADGDLLLRNRAADALFGGPDVPGRADPVSGHGFFDLDGNRVDTCDLPVVRALHGESTHGVDGRIVTAAHPGGRTVSVSAHPLPVEPGAAWSRGAVAALHDVTDVRAAADEVARAHDLFASVLDAATGHSIIAVDTTGAITLFNEGAERLLGWSAEEVLGRPALELHDPADVEEVVRQLGLADLSGLFARIRADGPLTMRCRYRRRDGTPVTVSLTSTPMHDGAGGLTGYMSMATDITAQLAAERRVEQSEALFRAAFDRNPVGIALVAVEDGGPGRVLRANRSMHRLAGRTEASLPGRRLDELVAPADVGRFLDALAPVVSGALPETTLDSTFTRADGSVVLGEVTATSLTSHDGEPLLLCLLEDVTEQRAAQRRLAHQAQHDSLTGLANRALLLQRLEQEVAEGGRSGRPLAVLYVDLDGFKAVNDTAGHAAGDRLLVAVAGIFTGCVRAGDTVARLGGDEFALLCPGATQTEAVAVGRRVLDALGAPIALGGADAVVGASIGVRWCDTWGGLGAEHVLHEADAAMYAAKRSGKGRIVVHGGDGAAGAQQEPPARSGGVAARR